MTWVTEDLFKKIIDVSKEVKKNLHKKGMITPVDNPDGSITIGAYTVVRDLNGFYIIVGRGNEIVAEQINLPQTALVLANNLALGKFLDNDLLQKDRLYGYAIFEEKLLKKSLDNKSRKDLQQFELILTKYLMVKSKKEMYRESIINSFEKLRKLV